MENNLKKNVIWNTIGVTLNSFNSLFFLITFFKIIVTITIRNIPTISNPFTKLSDMFKPPYPYY